MVSTAEARFIPESVMIARSGRLGPLWVRRQLPRSRTDRRDRTDRTERVFVGGVCLSYLVLIAACADAPRVMVLGAQEAPNPMAHPAPRHVHYDSTIDLPEDDHVVEPERPFVDSPQQRALVHIHTPTGTCSGVVLGPRLIATAHQCVPATRGISAASGPYRVELASSTLTWTTRAPVKVVAPDCTWDALDLAVLVLAEPVDWVRPETVGTVPDPGARAQALGFGHCDGEHRGEHGPDTIVSVDSQAFVIDYGLCKGDVGGFVVDVTGSLLGIVSHQDDPDNSPRRTTTIFRADTTVARRLFAQAKAVADGADPTTLKPIACVD
jgi:hypothetical protein